MIAQRRFAPLVALLLVGLGVVYARMAQVQLGEHEVWAREAANLVREGHTVPYHRGAILDRHGRVLVRDDDAYAVELVYRDFRRQHPLGQVAHARAALEMSAVSLHRAAARLLPWALELLALSPAAIERFEEGDALAVGALSIPAGDPRRERRAGRAGELRFYLEALLALERADRGRLRRAAQGAGRERSYLELAAEARGRPVAALEAELARRLAGAMERLEELAWRVGLEDEGGFTPFSRSDALTRLIEALQRERERIEDAIASELFKRAAGFPPSRVGTGLLVRDFDLSWIADGLRWSPERTELWLARVDEDRERDWLGLSTEIAILRAGLREPGESALERLYSELAAVFAAPPERRRARAPRRPDWKAVDALVVFDALDDLFEGVGLDPGALGPILPFQDPTVRAWPRVELDPALAPEEREAELAAGLARALWLPGDPPATPSAAMQEALRDWTPPAAAGELAQRLALVVEPGAAGAKPEWREDRRRLVGWFLDGWERRFREQLDLRLSELRARAGGAPLAFARWRRERAGETFAYVVRDYGSRPVVLDERPSYEVVYLLTRHPDDLEGFRVKQTTRRVAARVNELGQPVAGELVGRVRESTLEEVLAQRERKRRLADLHHQRLRGEEEWAEMNALVAQIYRDDEMHGSSGAEGLFDDLLRGENGYIEREGLQEREDRGGRTYQKEPVDGADLRLTLDLDLQAAALATLLRPELPLDEDHRDPVWFRSPVGSIALITPDGQVLAAASVPREPEAVGPGRDGQAAVVIDRTVRRPTFQPIGSVFKPFMALYALDRLGLDPAQRVVCERQPGLGGVAGYGDVRCHNPNGHGPVDLAGAIRVSCNSYFAWLGEQLGSKQALRELCDRFGFGHPTGLADTDLGRGLREDWRIPIFARPGELSDRQLQQAGNGLAVIEGTSLQVARALAGVATGALPTLRLDRPTEARPPRPGRLLELSPDALARVRAAMVEVVRSGSAAGKRLGVAELGFTLAAKTGSADYRHMTDEVAATLITPGRPPAMIKHTWLAGWFPAEEPVAVVVVQLHEVGFTSSHTAVHVASQFLRSEAVRRYVAEARR